MKNKSIYLCRCACIAALYVLLTFLSSAFGLASGVIQVRISEALTILPVFTFTAVPGLTVGCLIANILTGSVLIDCIGGAFATFIGAVLSYFLRKKPFLAFLPPVLSNAVIIPFILQYAYGVPNSYPYLMTTVGIGEIISVGIFGFILYKSLKNKPFLLN